MSRLLNPRQRLFVEHYLIDLNGKEAAIRAGYTPGAAMAARAMRSSTFFEGGIERVLAEYEAIAFADIGRVADWDDKRVRLKAKRRIAVDDSAAIASIGPVGKNAGSPGARLRLRLRLQLHDKVYALDALARHLGLLDPRMPGRALGRKWPVQRTSAALRARLGRA